MKVNYIMFLDLIPFVSSHEAVVITARASERYNLITGMLVMSKVKGFPLTLKLWNNVINEDGAKA